MKASRWQQWNAASGFAVLAVSAGAVAFERGAPPASASAAEITAFLAEHRTTLLTQSLLFVLGAGLLLWFLVGRRF